MFKTQLLGNIISHVNANQIGEKGVKELFARAEDEKNQDKARSFMKTR